MQDLLSDPFHIQQVRFLHGRPQDRSHHVCTQALSELSVLLKAAPFPGISSPRAASSLLLPVLAAPTLRQPFPLPQHAR